jgi:4-amino-4-deoxy-L-arabinose transferase-like glycosyltransferase
MRDKAVLAWLLWPVLLAEAVLTLPWLWRTAPFTDEALYLRAGHQEWSHWLHHAALPDYAGWFSGAPVLYPPLGAAADSIGGLAAARGLSLIIMLGTTGFVYLACARLFGRQAAFFASALFAVSGLVVHNGAFATFNPLALFFLSLGLWAAVKSYDEGYRWIAVCALALAASNAVKYATLAWDPVIIGIVVLDGWDRGSAEALRRGFSLAATVAVLDAGFLMLGGAAYVAGVKVTTVFRGISFAASEPPSVIFWRAFAITGALMLAAMAGVVVSAARRNPMPVTVLLALLVLAALIAPIDQAHLRQLGSLDKNMSFGLPFAAIAAGYAISAVIEWAEERLPAGRLAGSAAGAALILLVLIAGRLQTVQFRGPASAVAAKLISAVSNGYQRGTYIVSDGAARMEQYYLPQIPAAMWVGIFDPSAAQRARIRVQICAGRVSLVILRMNGGSYDHAYDYQIRQLISRIQRYKLAVTAGQGHYTTQVWQLAASSGKGPCK